MEIDFTDEDKTNERWVACLADDKELVVAKLMVGGNMQKVRIRETKHGVLAIAEDGAIDYFETVADAISQMV